MSKLQIENLQNLKSFNQLTTHETRLIIGATGDADIKYSFNDKIRGTSGNDTIFTDPIRIEFEGSVVYDLRDNLPNSLPSDLRESLKLD